MFKSTIGLSHYDILDRYKNVSPALPTLHINTIKYIHVNNIQTYT